MADTYFIKKLVEQRTKTAEAMFALQLGDSHGHARLKGVMEGLKLAEAVYRESVKSDDEELLS